MEEETTNTVAELEAENAYLRSIIRMARERLYDAHGRGEAYTAEVIRAVGAILRRGGDDTGAKVEV